eukprot:GHVR01111876.1.p2 GENE.GHVR01111876.1~~GHVR01111876.1.p2  ORF type:complete len:317 (+),score=51.28 GHVR01111876.1:553-1503(+)
MTLQQLEYDAYRRLGFGTTSPETVVQTRIRAYLNRWHRKILSSPGMQSMRRVSPPFSSVLNQPTYGMALRNIQFITDQTNNREVTEKSLAWYHKYFPDPARYTGTPAHYVMLGVTRVHTRPVSALALFVKSTAAGDTFIATVDVIRTNGYRQTLTTQMNGGVAAAFSATVTDVVDVVDFYVSVAAIGVITLHTVSGTGEELSRIQPGATTPRFLRFALAPTPSAVIPYTVDGITDVTDLATATDEPLLLLDFHDLLVDGAVYDEWISKGRESEARELRGEIEGRIRQLRAAAWEHSEEDRSDGRWSDDDGIHLPIA